MNHQLIAIAIISILIGISCGILIAILIKIIRRKQEVDSLIRPRNIVGLFGTVEVPFDRDSKGKIRVNIKGSIVDFIAMTDRPITLNKGDKVFIVEMKDSRVWVIPAEDLKLGYDSEN
ncbi:NfeD-like protein [Hydrococcus rivularis NIES-593]|uniref:NfeD-like protein n=1 Tax=Hydrococcus rivularis NIES-593 TaxID=1921803 RepID=A0A1U7HMK2_9CYAN|nr:NfeD family protein [Hydrococcus rivularis]OKH24784.1 NfeD-like protein [Hydrococcus rivularis NIES-593]